MTEHIHIVIAGGIVIGAYTNADSAELHRRIITGGHVVACELSTSVPREIVDDLVDEHDGDDVTPLDVITKPYPRVDTFDVSDIDDT